MLKRVVAMGWLGLSGLTPLFAVAQDIQAGEWQFDISYKLVGIPIPFPAYHKRQCIDTGHTVPDITREGQVCQTEVQSSWDKGSMLTWTLNCSTDWQSVIGLGVVTYYGDHATATAHMMTVGPNTPLERVDFDIHGHRIGSCSK